jgi:hypothetical protein
VTPGRLLIKSPGPGVFGELYEEEFIDSSETMQYLLDHPSLKWKDYTWQQGRPFPKGAIYINSAIPYAIGRATLYDGKTTVVGKVMGYYGFYYTVNGTFETRGNFQILTC